MKIVTSNHRPAAARVLTHAKSKRGILLMLLAVYSLVLLGGGAVLYRSGVYQKVVTPLRQNKLAVLPKIIKGQLSDPEQITIDIKQKEYLKLAYQRRVALQTGVLLKTDDDYVPAKIRYKGQTIRVKMRLKGDWIDHLEGNKWSFRIKVKGENTFWGMKQFSIHHPKTRDYLNEWIYHRALKREGVLGLRYEFIDVVLNGKELGIYALEEHFEKRLIEHNRLREGPIIRFSEDLVWRELVQQRQPFANSRRNGTGAYSSSEVDGFQTGKWLANPAVAGQYTRAVHLLELFRRGELKTSQVFDVSKMAKYFALCDLLGARHGTLWHNTRFYYNPVTSKLEPIGFDGDAGRELDQLAASVDGNFIERSSPVFNNYFGMLFRDPVFFKQYIKNLERVSDPAYLDQLFDDLDGELDKNLAILYKEFPFYSFSRQVYYRNQAYIRTVLNPVKGIHAYFRGADSAGLTLSLGTIQTLPIEILSLTLGDSAVVLPAQPVILPAKLESRPVEFREVHFPISGRVIWADSLVPDLKVQYRIPGAHNIAEVAVLPYPAMDETLTRRDVLRQPPNAEKFEFITFDAAQKRIVIAPGKWRLQENLIFPAGYSVHCSAGTEIDLSAGAKILSFSPLQFSGSGDDPVVITSSDSTGQGLAVIDAHERSLLENVVFNNLSNPQEYGWALSGAVTFYESPLDIIGSKFIGNRSEDGLNIVRSDFTMEQTLFSNTFSDAFDGDFVDGKISNTTFRNCGNDAIDVSGSVLDVENVTVIGAGDKGLSAGENSRMTGRGIDIRNSEIGVASKDQSAIVLEQIRITDCRIGFTPYQKKPEFGPASIRVSGLSLSRAQIPYLVEQGSSMTVDGVAIAPNRASVKEILYGVEFGKSSK